MMRSTRALLVLNRGIPTQQGLKRGCDELPADFETALNRGIPTQQGLKPTLCLVSSTGDSSQ